MRAIDALGQNFLTDKNVIHKIIGVLSAYPHETMLEVGPGRGAFTLDLALLARKLISVEKDLFLATELKNTVSEHNIENVVVIHGDILTFDPSSEIRSEYSLFGSLPYNISKRIIKKYLVEVDPKPTHLHVIVQKEVADLYRAKPPKATYLSNFAQIYSSVDYHFTISKNSFSPTPAVDGAFITFTLTDPQHDHEELSSFIRSMFKKPRKTIKNNLKYELSNLVAEQSDTPVDLSKRPAELSIHDFRKLFIVYNTQYNNGKKQKAKGASTSPRS